MEFRKYNSLENAKQKLVNIIETHGFANQVYVVTEKIHGANFGIHLDTETGLLRFSRRNAFLEADENFYNYTSMAFETRVAMEKISLEFPEAKVIRVFGELFGGSLAGVQEAGATRVQGEVEYSSKVEFMAFELQLDDQPQTFNEMARVVHGAGLMVVPILGVADNIYDALAYPNDDNSVVPALLGYDSPEVNIKEGNVIVPAGKVQYFGNGRRVAVKNKNSNFKESRSDKPITAPVELSEKAKQVYSEVLAHVTENRLTNVLSKELVEALTNKDFGRILGLLMQDALMEYQEEHGVVAKDDAGSEWTRVRKALTNEATTITRAYFIEHIF